VRRWWRTLAWVNVSFTGSYAVGRIVAQTCARHSGVHSGTRWQVRAIVLDERRPARVLPFLSFVTFMNNGEVRIAERVLAPRRRYDESSGVDPRPPPVWQSGPARQENRCGSAHYAAHREPGGGFRRPRCAGRCEVAIGGGRPDSQTRGWFFEPTVLVGRSTQHRGLAQHEIFGPVIAVSLTTMRPMRPLANDTPYGLSGTVWTSDHNRGLGIAAKVGPGTTASTASASMRARRSEVGSSPAWAANPVRKDSRSFFTRNRFPAFDWSGGGRCESRSIVLLATCMASAPRRPPELFELTDDEVLLLDEEPTNGFPGERGAGGSGLPQSR